MQFALLKSKNQTLIHCYFFLISIFRFVTRNWNNSRWSKFQSHLLHNNGVTCRNAWTIIWNLRGFVMHSAHTFGKILWGVIFPFTGSFSKNIYPRSNMFPRRATLIRFPRNAGHTYWKVNVMGIRTNFCSTSPPVSSRGLYFFT